MDIQIRQAEYRDVESMRGLFRQEANCQIVHDSFMARGLANPYVILVDGRMAGYGGVGNKYPPKRLIEFYVLPNLRRFALPMYRELLAVGQVAEMEAQSNLPLMLLMLYECAVNISPEAILFEDGLTTNLICPDGVFRQKLPEDVEAIFEHHGEPVGDWVIETTHGIVAMGGFMTHYNPPYGDIYMEVAEPARRQGVGGYLVQELKRVCYEAGRMPSARTGADNVASQATLQKAGLFPCARMLVGQVALST